MSNAWGALSWGQGSWAAQGDVEITVSGISATYSIGSVTATAIVEIGWGGDSWGENEWGDLSGSQPAITGVQASFSVGSISSVTGDANVSVSGISLSSSIGEEIAGISFTFAATGLQSTFSVGGNTIEIGVPVTGISTTSSIGTATVDESILTGEGWGRDAWGSFAWGVNYSVALTGQSLTSSIGSETAITDVDVSVTSAGQLTSTFASPSFSITIDQDIFVLASEDQLDASIGSLQSVTGDALVEPSGISLTSSIGNSAAGLFLDVPVTGNQADFTQGTISLVQSTNEPATGISATMTLGQHSEIPAQIVGVSGLSITSSLGEEGPVTGDALVTPTGQSLTSSVGSVNITAWSEIDLGVSNTWTVVDLAA